MRKLIILVVLLNIAAAIALKANPMPVKIKGQTITVGNQTYQIISLVTGEDGYLRVDTKNGKIIKIQGRQGTIKDRNDIYNVVSFDVVTER